MDTLYSQWVKAVKAAAKTTLLTTRENRTTERKVSTRTKELISKREKMNPRKCSREKYEALQSKIKESSLRDFKSWINANVQDMERSYAQKNTRKLFAIVNKLSKKAKPPPQNLKTDESDKLLESSTEAAKVWLMAQTGHRLQD